jgi:8-oxo-dGTP pyrophosphatase MutT (NUDIX family)
LEDTETKTYQLFLEHSEICPNRKYREMCQKENEATDSKAFTEELRMKYSDRNVKLAVCMALFDKDHRILLTRRNANMHTFPHAWVMPGGHIDLGESLEFGVIRELLEETGVNIETKIDLVTCKERYFHNDEECILEPFYAFESVSWRATDT